MPYNISHEGKDVLLRMYTPFFFFYGALSDPDIADHHGYHSFVDASPKHFCGCHFKPLSKVLQPRNTASSWSLPAEFRLARLVEEFGISLRSVLNARSIQVDVIFL